VKSKCANAPNRQTKKTHSTSESNLITPSFHTVTPPDTHTHQRQEKKKSAISTSSQESQRESPSGEKFNAVRRMRSRCDRDLDFHARWISHQGLPRRLCFSGGCGRGADRRTANRCFLGAVHFIVVLSRGVAAGRLRDDVGLRGTFSRECSVPSYWTDSFDYHVPFSLVGLLLKSLRRKVES